VDREVNPQDSMSNTGSRSRALLKKSLCSGLRVSEKPGHQPSATKRASLQGSFSMQATNFVRRRRVVIKGLKYQQEEEALLHLDQQKHQLQLETDIAKM